MSAEMRVRAERAAVWIASASGAPAPVVGESPHGFPFSVGGLDFVYMGRGWRYDDDPWNERNLSRVEYDEGPHVFLRCPRHGVQRVYPYGPVPWEMPAWAAYGGSVKKCEFCKEPALFDGHGSNYRGQRFTTPMCAHCAKVRFGIPSSSLADEPFCHPVFTEDDLRRDTQGFLAAVHAWNAECHKCVTLVYHNFGPLIDTVPMLRRTYQIQ